MSDDFLKFGEMRRKRGRTGPNPHNSRSRKQRFSQPEWDSERLIGDPEPEEEPRSFTFPIDPWRLVDAVRQRWLTLFLIAALLGGIGFFSGFFLATFNVEVHLAPHVPANPYGETFGPSALPYAKLARLAHSPDLLRAVTAASEHPISPAELAKRIELHPARYSEELTLSLRWKDDPRVAVDLINNYATNFLHFTAEIRRREAEEISGLLARRIESTDRELDGLKDALIRFSAEAKLLDWDRETEAYINRRAEVETEFEAAQFALEELDLRIKLARENPGFNQLREAQARLESLLLRFREAHPDVMAAREQIRRLQGRALGNTGTNASPESVAGEPAVAAELNSQLMELENQKVILTNQIARLDQRLNSVQERISGLSASGVQYATLNGRIQALETLRGGLIDRQREARMFQENSFASHRIVARAQVNQVTTFNRWAKIAALTFFCAFVGLAGTTGVVLISEVMDSRIKTLSDLERVTALPVLATLGDLEKMKPDQQVDWAFRTLTILKGKLTAHPDQSLVCGFISARPGEGRSTWINLLVNAASRRGFRVLTVDTRAPADPPGRDEPEAERQPSPAEQPADQEPGPRLIASQLPAPAGRSLPASVLDSPGEIAKQFDNPDAQPVIHIPLPGWVWDLERRKHWQAALNHWSRIDNLILLVELPPASKPEAVLLAENLPQLVWLTSSGMVSAAETSEHLETLRHARCNLVGTVLNREPSTFWNKYMSRWLGKVSFLVALTGFALNAAETDLTQSTPSPEPAPNGSMAAAPGTQRAPWQERFTIGPGDIFDIALYGSPDSARTNVFIQPDGRLSYLQVRDLTAAGLTVDELRTRLDEELSVFYPAPRTMIVPVAFTSKKYFVLGKVNQRGAFLLNRPVTVIEAVARAGGLETGLYDRKSIELADLSRSFLIRQGEPVPINFEQLFWEGDLSQNIVLHPDDYLYFPSAGLNEIYILGEVLSPGIVPHLPRMTAIGAITARGGFTPRAWSRRVLVVRGSLNTPETFTVNAADILAAREPDFLLEPRDIIFVRHRPWARAEELLDEAAHAFLQAVVTTWVGRNLGPVITTPIIPVITEP